jgi:outer membrane receptor for ferrienterochelin and colicin
MYERLPGEHADGLSFSGQLLEEKMRLKMNVGKWIWLPVIMFSENVRAQVPGGMDTLRHITVDDVTVSSFRPGTILSSSSSFKTEIITQTGLKKMACCNLSESFENSASATVGFTDAVSGAKQIQLLGLSGIYSRTLAENVPVLHGLASTYGLSHIPASWLESIQISKGVSSVVNGYESITGQMNLEFKKPNNTDPLFINLYTDDDRHYEANLTSAVQLNGRLWAGLLLSGTLGTGVHDENRDNFLDMPKIKYVNVYNRWFYLNDEKDIQSRTGIKFLYEDRKAGQDSLCHIRHNIPLDGVELWESFITNRDFTVYNKTGISIGDREDQSLGIISSFTHYEQNSVFGRKMFNGTQNSFYLNVLFSSFIKNTNHRYIAGASFAYDRYGTEFEDKGITSVHTPLTPVNRTEAVPGVFAEYTYSSPFRLTVAAGGRTDYNSRFGWLVTPRLNVRYDVREFMTVRASAGRGFRSPNALAENTGLMASSRTFDISALHDLNIEQAWNFGGNITFNIPLWDGRQARLSCDYFHTNFQNQIIVDTERNRNAVFFYNSGGSGNYSNAWQTDVSATLFRGFELFAAFRCNNNRITYTDGAQQAATDKPLVSAYRGLINLSYATPLRRWVFDTTAQLNGRTRLPGLNGYDSEKIYSQAFPVYFAQITHNRKRFDVYASVENLSGYRQKDPIREWTDPFGRDFDASMVWGQLSGARIYGGIRLRIGKLY